MISPSLGFTSSKIEQPLSNHKLLCVYLYQIDHLAVKENLRIVHRHIFRMTSDRNARNTKKSSHTYQLGHIGLICDRIGHLKLTERSTGQFHLDSQSVNSRKNAYNANGSACVIIPLGVQSPLSVDIRLASEPNRRDDGADNWGTKQHVIRTTITSIASPAGRSGCGPLRHRAGAACG